MTVLRTLPQALLLALLIAPPVSAETVQITLKNGDTINAELVEEESSETVKVVIHPQLGRLEVSQDAIKPKEKPPAWKSSISAGVNATDKDGDGTFSANINGSSRYNGETDTLKILGSFNYSRNDDKDKPAEVKTEKGMGSIRYERKLSDSFRLYASSNYDYNGLNKSGINTVTNSVGAAFPVLDSEKVKLTLSLGPSLRWSDGGKDCDTSEYCGNTYGGGSFITDLSWKPNPAFRFSINNNLSAISADEIKPTNTFTAAIKFFPSITSGLFTSLQFISIYDSMNAPEQNNSVTGQVGYEF